MTDYLDEIFGPAGAFAQRFVGYEPRSQQLELAAAIDRGMRERQHVLGEGPCGSGKGLSYLVPGIWHALKTETTLVVATATIALQEQLISKDLPALAETLPWGFTYALLKGRSNYACLNKIYRADRSDTLDMTVPDIAMVADWLCRTGTGDRSELPREPSARTWSLVSATSDECLGEDCWLRKHCFSENARKQAANATVIVTNYHLLFLHLLLRAETGQDLLLPPFQFVVMDEAHEAADVARDVFGVEVSERAVTDLIADAEDLWSNNRGDVWPVALDDAWDARMRRAASKLFEIASSWVRFCKKQRRSTRLRDDGLGPNAAAVVRELTEGFAVACAGARAITGFCREALKTIVESEEREDLERILGEAIVVVRRLIRICGALERACDVSDPNVIVSVEGGSDGKAKPKIRVRALDVAPVLRAELFNKASSVVAVSATMTVAESFDFVRGELGAPEDKTLELAVDSPFDFEAQATLYVPTDEHVPLDPKDAQFAATAVEQIVRVVEACDGRTLVLCTSNKDAAEAHRRLEERVGDRYRLLLQGQLPRNELARIFKEDASSILIGVRSFWTGIDVPGDALTGLVIWKLPFPPPDDPLIDALTARDADYLKPALPRAVMMLRQGIGRLIRSRSDIGVVAVLDRRMLEMKRYRDEFTRSLPNFNDVIRDPDAIAAFLEARR